MQDDEHLPVGGDVAINYGILNNLQLHEPQFRSSHQSHYLSADGDVAVGEAENGAPSQPCCMKPAANVPSRSAFNSVECVATQVWKPAGMMWVWDLSATLGWQKGGFEPGSWLQASNCKGSYQMVG